MGLKTFLTPRHVSTPRSYAGRASEDKPSLARVAKKFGHEYWDGPRETGYGGYVDDGRWAKIAAHIAEEYGLGPEASVLDIGCGKGFFLKAIRERLPQARVKGIDVSEYALREAPPEIRPFLENGSAQRLQEKDHSFDLVVAMNTLHNLELPDLFRALRDIQRISRDHSYVCVESYRNEEEKWNLLRWQLTCECFFTPGEWEWIFEQTGYTGDYEFIFFR